MNLSKKVTREKVQVLLSTYNGSMYLEPLINSILDQDYPNIEIIIRDDGSIDNTLNILRRYTSYENISVIKGSNVGLPHSFFVLLQMSSPNADYFSFCDQDDVWQKDKLSRAINLLKKLPNSIPAMYCGRVLVVDKHLNVIGHSPILKRKPSFKNALVENIATGCTIVINRAARNIIVKKIPKHALMHDWWIYLVVSAFGVVVYDPEPKILYRQHSSNAVGIRNRFFDHWKARTLRFLKYRRGRLLVKQAEEFNDIYGNELSTGNKRLLERFINIENRRGLISRIQYAFCGELYRQSIVDNVLLKSLILLGYI